MKYQINLALIGVLSWALANCSGERPSTSDVGKSTPPAVSAPREILKTQIHALPQPNRYQVHLEWERVEREPDAWVVHREDALRGLRHLGTFEKNRREFLDTSVVAGETYHYYLSNLETSDLQVKLRATVSIPRDLEIVEDTRLKEIIGINRLFLRNGVHISSGKERLLIEVNEILSSGGTIQSYGAESVAASGKDGNSGGAIVIHAKTGSGILNVVGRGESGGIGRPGAKGTEGARGKRGASAQLEIRHTSDNEASREARRLLIQKLEETVAEDKPGWSDFYNCKSGPTDGEKGENGGNGGTGESGGKGGDSAKIYVEVQNPSELLVRPVVAAGFGGLGGVGGEGGAGGAGGEAGLNDRHRLCKEAKPGVEGIPGVPGKLGEFGANGKVLPYCLKLGPGIFGDCRGYEIPGVKVW